MPVQTGYLFVGLGRFELPTFGPPDHYVPSRWLETSSRVAIDQSCDFDIVEELHFASPNETDPGGARGA
jgi:hypothetical protein